MMQWNSAQAEIYPLPTDLLPGSEDIRLLFPLYCGVNGCVPAAMRYSYQSSILSNDREETANALRLFSQQELFHAGLIGKVIHSLGGNPRFIQPARNQFWHAGLVCYQQDPAVFLITDLRIKLNAVDELLSATSQIKSQNLRPLLERIAVESEEQVKKLQLLIRKCQ